MFVVQSFGSLFLQPVLQASRRFASDKSACITIIYFGKGVVVPIYQRAEPTAVENKTALGFIGGECPVYSDL
jgi:hypothetical protein